MGADVHMYVEYLRWSQDTFHGWHCIIEEAGWRDYTWFGIIGGVRRHGIQQIPTRGMPEPCSTRIERNAVEQEGHSHSYMSTAELAACIARYTMMMGHPPDPETQAIHAMMEQLESCGYTARLVFWFDN